MPTPSTKRPPLPPVTSRPLYSMPSHMKSKVPVKGLPGTAETVVPSQRTMPRETGRDAPSTVTLLKDPMM